MLERMWNQYSLSGKQLGNMYQDSPQMQTVLFNNSTAGNLPPLKRHQRCAEKLLDKSIPIRSSGDKLHKNVNVLTFKLYT